MNNMIHRTGFNWIPVHDRAVGFAADFAAEDLLDAPDWIPTGSTQTHESCGFLLIMAETIRPGTFE